MSILEKLISAYRCEQLQRVVDPIGLHILVKVL